MATAGPEAVSTVRSFNRFYTKVMGLLSEGLLQTPYSLTEARVIFDLAKGDATEVVPRAGQAFGHRGRAAPEATLKRGASSAHGSDEEHSAGARRLASPTC